MTTKIPQVILLGNGINRAYGGASWNELLKEISSGKYKDVDKLRCPMPLKAILVTDDHINGPYTYDKLQLRTRNCGFCRSG